MANISGVLLSATVTVLMAFFYFYATFRVGTLRGKHNIRAPACSGHPEFDRAYRVQMNSFEQMGIVLPLLWVATIYPVLSKWIAPAIGLIWVIGRIIYMRTYMADPEKRLLGASIGGVCNLALLLLSVAGVLAAWTDLK